jgi:hypothetical protein
MEIHPLPPAVGNAIMLRKLALLSCGTGIGFVEQRDARRLVTSGMPADTGWRIVICMYVCMYVCLGAL